VNKVDAWGLESEGANSGDKPYYCRWSKCDDNGTLQGDYKPIEGRDGVPPFMIQFPMLDPIAWPFENYYERHKIEKH